MNIGLVGCGNIGSLHSSILTDDSSAVNNELSLKLSAFADFDVSRATSFSEKYTGGNAGTYASLSEMLDLENIQTVHICTPHYLHVPMAVECLSRNINVLLEKPPAMNREELKALRRAESESEARLGIVFQNRYNPATKVTDELLSNNRIGKLDGARAFVTWKRDADYYVKSGWRGRLETEGGGVLINQSIHTLDLLCRWLGPCTGVKASMQNHHLEGVIEVEDMLEASLEFGDKKALFYATTDYVEDSNVMLELHGSEGVIRLGGDKVILRTGSEECVITSGYAQNHGAKAYWGCGHEACICDFYRSIESGSVFQNELASALDTMDAMIKIYEYCRCDG